MTHDGSSAFLSSDQMLTAQLDIKLAYNARGFTLINHDVKILLPQH